MRSDDPSLSPLVQKLLREHRFSLSNEKETQREIASVLSSAAVPFQREVRLSPSDIPDFLLPRGLLIEVKMHSARPAEIIRQLRRYAIHPRVTELFLVTNRMGAFPPAVAEKPLSVISLGKAWI